MFVKNINRWAEAIREIQRSGRSFGRTV